MNALATEIQKSNSNLSEQKTRADGLFLSALFLRLFGSTKVAERWFDGFAWFLWLVFPLDIWVTVTLTGDSYTLIQAMVILCVKLIIIAASAFVWSFVPIYPDKNNIDQRRLASTEFAVSAVAVWAAILVLMLIFRFLVYLDPDYQPGAVPDLLTSFLTRFVAFSPENGIIEALFYYLVWFAILIGLVSVLAWFCAGKSGQKKGDPVISGWRQLTFWMPVGLLIVFMQALTIWKSGPIRQLVEM